MIETRKKRANHALGALVQADGVLFRLWAPEVKQVDLVLENGDQGNGGQAVPMQANDEYFERFMPGLAAGTRYRFRADLGSPLPDPASRFQPEGIHGPSEVVDPNQYRWGDEAWSGVPLAQCVFYELHVGTFTPEGTFRSAIERLPYLRDLGITAIELMPVDDFPGRWNWGYDPAAMYAPSRAYGTPDDLRSLVDAAHQLGMAVYLDVIYNHFGPDGAYAAAFGRFFTDKHSSPWGQGINLDDRHSAGARGFFIDNALYWLREYHIDGLRLDATHALQDDSQTHFLAELATVVRALPGRRRYLIAEDCRNLDILVRPQHSGGYGLDAIWADDFHHQIRNLTAGDTDGYFEDYIGTTAEELAATLRQGWFYTGQNSPHDGQPRGSDPVDLPHDCFVHCIQNHDQVGNRAKGERLHHQIPLDLYRAVSALLLFSPKVPLLFMGQEWAASSPFQFFTDHSEELGKAVSEGRKREFKKFAHFQGEVPDPQDPATFERSKLRWDELQQPPHQGVLNWYRDLIRLRGELPAECEIAVHGERSLSLHRGRYHLLVALAEQQRLPLPAGATPLLQSEDARYGGEGKSVTFEADQVVFQRPGAVVVVAPT